MRVSLVAMVAALGFGAVGLAGCGDGQMSANTDSYTPDSYSQQQARRDAQQLPPAEMPNPDTTAPAVPTAPRSTDPLDPTDPQAQPPGSPPPVLPPRESPPG